METIQEQREEKLVNIGNERHGCSPKKSNSRIRAESKTSITSSTSASTTVASTSPAAPTVASSSAAASSAEASAATASSTAEASAATSSEAAAATPAAASASESASTTAGAATSAAALGHSTGASWLREEPLQRQQLGRIDVKLLVWGERFGFHIFAQFDRDGVIFYGAENLVDFADLLLIL